MAHVCAQGLGASLFETLTFLLKAVLLASTFSQETLERVLSQSVLTYLKSWLPGARRHRYFVCSIHVLFPSLLRAHGPFAPVSKGPSPPCVRVPCPCPFADTSPSHLAPQHDFHFYGSLAVLGQTGFWRRGIEAQPPSSKPSLTHKVVAGLATSSPHTVPMTHGDSEDTDLR